MSRFYVLSLLLLAAVAVACSNNKNAADAIPDKPILRPAPSQPLTLSEYTQFKNFVQTESGAQIFLPQAYLFAKTDESHLTSDQQSALLKIRGNCQISDTPTHAGDDNPKPGSTITTTDTRRVTATNCPIAYSLDQSLALTISADSNSTSQSASGPISVKEVMTITDSALANTFGDYYSSSNAMGTFSLFHSDNQTKIRVTISSANVWNAVLPQNNHSENTDADLIISANNQNNSATIGIAINITMTVPQIAKPVVISFAGSVDSVHGQTTLDQFMVNGAPVTGTDQQELMNNVFMEGVLTRILATSGAGAKGSGLMAIASQL